MTPSSPQPPAPSPGAQGAPIVLAFSGGLDTSFCVPWLQERGWAVHTVFADTGGVDAEERAAIEARAAELGVASHVTIDGGPAIWDGFVKPFVWAGRSEEHTSEIQSLMRISYAVFCLKKKNHNTTDKNRFLSEHI